MDEYLYPVAYASALLLSASVILLYYRKLRGVQNATTNEGKAGEPADDRMPVRILFGTQTGTAEKFAKQLASKLADVYGESARFLIDDMEHYDHESKLPSEKLVFLLMATYGDGEPTDNALNFCNWLEKASSDVMDGECQEVLQGTHYAVFGLGNRQYEHFNAVGKAVHKHLQTVGGVPLAAVGLGDDDADIADDFELWTDALLSAIDAGGLLLRSRKSADHSRAVGYTVQVYSAGSKHTGELATASAGLHGSGTHVPKAARVAAVRELHGAASDRSCVHVELDLAGTGMTYEHGDHVAVFARNSAETVQHACVLLGMDPDAVIDLSVPPGNPEMLPPPYPGPLTLRDALAHHHELLQHPDKAALAVLAGCASDPAEAQRLRHLASHDGKAEYAAWVVQSQRSLLQMLQAFPSARPSLGVFLSHLAPRLLPRYYSISSSPLQHPDSVHVTAAVVDEVGPTGRRHRGVATTHLANCKPGDAVTVFIRHSTFKLPSDASKPVVMIGPGTGLAPFRGFLQHRAALRRCGDALGSAALFFGCRHPEKDYIYQSELEGYKADGVLGELHTAFSRVSDSKDYVQHHLLRSGDSVYKALEAGGSLYVCGDAKHMAKDVHRVLHDVVKRCQNSGNAEAEAFVKQLQKEGRYMQDVW